MKRQDRVNRASLGIRLIAFGWDYLLIASYLVLLVGLSYGARPWLASWFGGGPLRAELAGFLFLTLPVYLYFAISEGTGERATWGKRKMKIEVAVGRNGEPIGWGRSLLRSGLKFVPWELAHFTVWHMVRPSGYADAATYGLLGVVYGLVLLFLLVPLLNRDRRTLYDFAAGTVVQRSSREDIRSGFTG